MTDRQKLAYIHEYNENLWNVFLWLWEHNDKFTKSELGWLNDMERYIQNIAEYTNEAYQDEQRSIKIDNILKELSDEENGLWATMIKITEDYKTKNQIK